MWLIYALRRDGVVFYVGATSRASRRFVEHKRKFGHDIELTPLETCGADWRDREHIWLERYRSKGVLLVNKTAGRNGCET